jgi:hypothetical protein
MVEVVRLDSAGAEQDVVADSYEHANEYSES